MSYFMTMAGPWIDLSALQPIELIPIDKAQPYVRQQEELLSKEDGQPLFLIHDGETGTSHNFITAAEQNVNDDPLADSSLLALFKLLCDGKHVFRIWWPSGNETDVQYPECTSLEEVINVAAKQIISMAEIQLRYTAPGSHQQRQVKNR